MKIARIQCQTDNGYSADDGRFVRETLPILAQRSGYTIPVFCSLWKCNSEHDKNGY